MRNTRHRWKKTIYIAKQLKDKDGEPVLDKYGRVSYEKPKKYLFNVQPIGGTTNSTSGRTAIKDYGQKAMEMQRAVIDYNSYVGKFDVDDIAYLDGKSPKGEEIYGQNANYRIDAVLNQNVAIVLYFEKLATKK